jgi:hypothetical protein
MGNALSTDTYPCRLLRKTLVGGAFLAPFGAFWGGFGLGFLVPVPVLGFFVGALIGVGGGLVVSGLVSLVLALIPDSEASSFVLSDWCRRATKDMERHWAAAARSPAPTRAAVEEGYRPLEPQVCQYCRYRNEGPRGCCYCEGTGFQ